LPAGVYQKEALRAKCRACFAGIIMRKGGVFAICGNGVKAVVHIMLLFFAEVLQNADNVALCYGGVFFDCAVQPAKHFCHYYAIFYKGVFYIGDFRFGFYGF
jgi:hypothetical protein